MSGFKAFDLTGQVALITGGNSGIGLGMAQAVAEAGADVVIWGTNAAKNEHACAVLAPSGTRVRAFQCDVSDEAQVDSVFEQSLAAMGKIDACFANAGIGGGGKNSFVEMSAAQWRNVMAVNLDGAFYTFRAAARHLVERGQGGRLIGTASLAAIEGAARNEHYGATKGGMVSMIRALAVEFARYGITANAILPGWIATDMTSSLTTNEKFASNVLQRVPMRRWGEGADFGGIAVYLMSKASSFHTGDSFLIDGGYALY